MAYNAPEVLERLAKLLTTEEKDKAKFAVAMLVLIRLLMKAPLTRSQMTQPFQADQKAGKAVMHLIRNGKWVRDSFLKQLIDLGHIQAINTGSGLMYDFASPDKAEILGDILTEALTGEGLALKKVLWPADYGSPVEEELEVEESPASTSDEDPDEGLDAIKALTQELTVLADHLGKIYQGVDALGKQMGVLTAQMEATEKRLGETEQRLTEKLAVLDRLTQSTDHAEQLFSAMMTALKDERNSKLKSILDRLTESALRKRSLQNQLESEGRKDEKLQEELAQELAKEKS